LGTDLQRGSGIERRRAAGGSATVDPGVCNVEVGDTATGTVLSGQFDFGTAIATSGGAGARQYVEAGDTASASFVTNGGIEFVFAGATAGGTTRSSGGPQPYAKIPVQ
jgi:autotransporter passenger strand-loop-strand repeat protein